jgi:hypothetical protein
MTVEDYFGARLYLFLYFGAPEITFYFKGARRNKDNFYFRGDWEPLNILQFSWPSY